MNDERLAILGERLSEDELARAARFRFEHLRRRFIAARGALREILGEYLCVEAKTISFVYGPHGKPGLGEPWRSSEMRFNLSHAEGLALIAIAKNAEVGVDVERIDRKISDADDIARRYFSSEEIIALDALPAAERRAGFFRCWTRKEAFIKATGIGLSMPLDSFAVSLEPATPSIIRIDGEERANQRWSILDAKPDDEHEAAVVVEGKATALSFFRR